MSQMMRNASLTWCCAIAQGCCGPAVGTQVREQMAVSQDSRVRMGGAIPIPPSMDMDITSLLMPGSTERQILERVGPPDRKLPAIDGELWIWDMQFFATQQTLAVLIVDGHQRGAAIRESRTIPAFLLHHDRLEAGADVKTLVDQLGSPSRWEVVGTRTTLIWEAAVQLEPRGLLWQYSQQARLHTLRLEIVDDRLVAAAAIESHPLVAWPTSASQSAAEALPPARQR